MVFGLRKSQICLSNCALENTRSQFWHRVKISNELTWFSFETETIFSTMKGMKKKIRKWTNANTVKMVLNKNSNRCMLQPTKNQTISNIRHNLQLTMCILVHGQFVDSFLFSIKFTWFCLISQSIKKIQPNNTNFDRNKLVFRFCFDKFACTSKVGFER